MLIINSLIIIKNLDKFTDFAHVFIVNREDLCLLIKQLSNN